MSALGDGERWRLDYAGLAAGGRTADAQALGPEVVRRWLAQYRAFTEWDPEVYETRLGDLTYLFDMAPSSHELADADDRVVGVWGVATSATAERERARQRGFVPDPGRWSGSRYDRGHFVAHSLGGGMDINFFPQAQDLNRGTSERGRRWRALERHALLAGAPLLFVRPIYVTRSWTPAYLEFSVVTGDEVRAAFFTNDPRPSGRTRRSGCR